MEKRRISQTILHRFLGRILLTCLLYLAALVLLLLFSAALFGSVIWYGTEPLFPLFTWISKNKLLFVILLFTAGIFVIFIYYFRRLLRYLEEILSATEHMHEDAETWVSLPKELSEVENQLNAIQNKIVRNRRAAKAAEQRKNDLVVYLAHDLKTPLTSVIGYLTLLREEQEISPALRERYLAISLEKAERLEDLINEFFEITRFNLTTMELKMGRVNLTRMLEQTIFEFSPMLEEKHLSCELEAPKDIMIHCDADKMQRVFDNLLRNGVNYGYPETVIRVSVKKQDNRITLRFENQGPTIPEEKLERIFEQFYRLDSARSSGTGGAGLGLCIAKEIVRLHGGTMSATSSGEQTAFLVELPESS